MASLLLPCVHSRHLAGEPLSPPDPCRLQSPAKHRKRRNVLGEGSTGLVEANRRASIDAFECHWLLADIKYMLIPEHCFDVTSVPYASNEAPPAAVHHNSDLRISTRSGRVGQERIAGAANRLQSLDRLTQARYRIHACHDDAIGSRDDLIGPCEPGDRQVDQDQLITLRCQIEQRI